MKSNNILHLLNYNQEVTVTAADDANIINNNDNSNNNVSSDEIVFETEAIDDNDINNGGSSSQYDNNKIRKNVYRQHFSPDFVTEWIDKFLILKLEALETKSDVTNDQIRCKLNELLNINIKQSTASRLINKVLEKCSNHRGKNSEVNSEYITIGRKLYSKDVYADKIIKINNIIAMNKDKERSDLKESRLQKKRLHKRIRKRKVNELGGDDDDDDNSEAAIDKQLSSSSDDDEEAEARTSVPEILISLAGQTVSSGTSSSSLAAVASSSSSLEAAAAEVGTDSRDLVVVDDNDHVKPVKPTRQHYSSEFVTTWLHKYVELKEESKDKNAILTDSQARVALNEFFNVEIKPATANRFIHKLTKSSRNEVFLRRGRKINNNFEIEVINQLLRNKHKKGVLLKVVGQFIGCTHKCFRDAAKTVQKTTEPFVDDVAVQRLKFSDHWVDNLIIRYQRNKQRCYLGVNDALIISQDNSRGSYCLDIRKRPDSIKFIDIYLSDYSTTDAAGSSDNGGKGSTNGNNNDDDDEGDYDDVDVDDESGKDEDGKDHSSDDDSEIDR